MMIDERVGWSCPTVQCTTVANAMMIFRDGLFPCCLVLETRGLQKGPSPLVYTVSLVCIHGGALRPANDTHENLSVSNLNEPQCLGTAPGESTIQIFLGGGSSDHAMDAVFGLDDRSNDLLDWTELTHTKHRLLPLELSPQNRKTERPLTTTTRLPLPPTQTRQFSENPTTPL
jgi:hypothetical protein